MKHSQDSFYLIQQINTYLVEHIGDLYSAVYHHMTSQSQYELPNYSIEK